MTTKKELLDKIAELQAKVDAMPDDKPARPRGMPALQHEVKEEQEVWLAYDAPVPFRFSYDGSSNNCLWRGELFLTEEDCQIHIDRQKVTQELREMAYPFVPDWNDADQKKWCLYYDYRIADWDTNFQYMVRQVLAEVYFATGKAAREAKKKLGDRLDVLL